MKYYFFKTVHEFYDMLSNGLFNEKGELMPTYFTKDLDCSGFSVGMYIVTITTDKERLSKKFVRE